MEENRKAAWRKRNHQASEKQQIERKGEQAAISIIEKQWHNNSQRINRKSDGHQRGKIMKNS